MISLDSEQAFLLKHSAHNYERLIERWKAVAEATGLKISQVAEHCGKSVFALRSAKEPDEKQGIYLSAGVHGDEPGGSEGLIAWAEGQIDFLKQAACVIFPCFNPSGIIDNTRADSDGLDLNRQFDSLDHPLFAAWREFLGESKFRIGLCLHEDYDAHGTYVYELAPPELAIGENSLAACASIIPPEPDPDIEGRPAAAGVIRPTESLEELFQMLKDEEAGVPEAIVLQMERSSITLTFETPSEYSLYARVRTQMKFIETALSLAGISQA